MNRNKDLSSEIIILIEGCRNKIRNDWYIAHIDELLNNHGQSSSILNNDSNKVESLKDIGRPTSSQVTALRKILDANKNQTKQFILLVGFAGTGKSTTIDLCKARIREEGKSFVVCSTTGTNARKNNGFTLFHALGCNPNDVKYRRYKKPGYKKTPTIAFTELDYIFIDEASMMDKSLFDALKFYLKPHQTVILTADLSQLPPVSLSKNAYTIKDQLFFIVGPELEPILLTEKVRQNENDGFAKILDRIATTGWYPELNDEFSHEYFYSQANKADIQKKIAFNLLKAASEEKNIPYIAAKREDCEEVNNLCMELIGDHSSKIYEPKILKTDMVSKLHPSIRNRVKHQVDKAINDNKDDNCTTLKLCLGHKVMITINDQDEDHTEMEYANGTVGTVVMLHDDYVGVRLWDNDKVVLLSYERTKEYIRYKDENGKEKSFCYKAYMQIPLMSAWAITAHKSQGMTADEAYIDPANAFGPCMVYTMLSRVRTRAGVHLVNAIKEKNVIINQYAADFYRFIQENGRSYNKDELKYLEWGCTIPLNRAFTSDDLKYVKDKESALARYDEYAKYDAKFRENGLPDCSMKITFDLWREFDLHATVERMLEFNKLSAVKDPRLPAAISQAIDFGDEDLKDRFLNGEFDDIVDPYKYGYPVLDMDNELRSLYKIRDNAGYKAGRIHENTGNEMELD